MGSPTSNPRVNIQLLPAAIVDAFDERRNLIIGQIGTGGAATDDNLNVDMHTLKNSELKALFGSGELYYRILSWRSAVNVAGGGILPKLDVIGVSPSTTGVAATATVTFTGPATSDGEYTISVVDESQFTRIISVENTDTATDIASKVVTAFNTLTDLPFTVTSSTGVVTFTAKDKGTIGNTFGIKTTGFATGTAATVAGFTNGVNDPTLTDVFDDIEGRRYTGISWPEFWNQDVNLVIDLLDSRFNVSNNILDGVAFHGYTDTFANDKTEVAKRNSQSLVYMGNNDSTITNHKGPAILIPADWVCSYFMGVRAKRLTTGAQISDLITATNSPADATGGPALASLPYFNTPLPDVPVTAAKDLFSLTEQVELEDEGFSTYGVNTAGNFMITGPVVTTWTTDAAGNPNDSFHYLNYVDTGSVCREIFFRTLKSAFAQSRLTQGDLVPGRSIANTGSIGGELQIIYRLLADIALTQKGSEAETFFIDNTTVEITDNNLSTRSVTINGPLPIVTQLGTINYNLSLNFSVATTGTQITL